MLDDVKLAFKDLIQNSLDRNNICYNDLHEIGFTIARFILIKESMIKKCDVGGNEKTSFNVDENLAYLDAINKFAWYIRNNKFDINLNGNIVMTGVHSKCLKENVEIIHIIRNSLAHGKYDIDNGYIKIDNPGYFVGDIEISVLEDFNNEVSKVFGADEQSNDITNIFFNNSEINGKKLFYMSLYTYMMLVCATNDMKLVSSDRPTIYSEPHFVEDSHMYCDTTKSVFDVLDKAERFNAGLDNLFKHLNERYYTGMQNQEQQFHDKICSSLNNKLFEEFRSIRNAIEHANVMFGFDRATLFDMGNQADENSKHFEIDMKFEQLFYTLCAIDEGASYNNDFAYFSKLLTLSDRRFLPKLQVLIRIFNLLLNNKYYPSLEDIESDIYDGDDKFTVKEVINILNNLYCHSDLDMYLVFKKLDEYAERLFNEYNLTKDELAKKYPLLTEDVLEDESFIEYDNLVQYLGTSASMLNETLDLQTFAYTIIDNHEQLADDYSTVSEKHKQKIR